jgi:hypothetical protein
LAGSRIFPSVDRFMFVLVECFHNFKERRTRRLWRRRGSRLIIFGRASRRRHALCVRRNEGTGKIGAVGFNWPRFSVVPPFWNSVFVFVSLTDKPRSIRNA